MRSKVVVHATIQRVNPIPAPQHKRLARPMPDPHLQRLLESSPWARTLTPSQRLLVENNTAVKHIPAGGFVCRKGESVDYWIGIVKGLVKMASISADGKPTTSTGRQVP